MQIKTIWEWYYSAAVSLRAGVRLRETFFEQGQVLPVDELFHS